jgi:segregation and condensation protein A
MQVLEKTIPWWRKALKFALGGIRSGFGFFPRSARLAPVAVPMFSGSFKENLEEERALTKPFPKIEMVAPAIPAGRGAEHGLNAESESEPEKVKGKAGATKELSEETSSGAKQAAEKPGISGEIGGKHPSGAKALDDLTAFTARLKSCPDTRQAPESSFSAAHETEVAREAKIEPEPEAVPLPATESQAMTEAEPVAVPVPVAGGALDGASKPPAAEAVNAEVVNEDVPEPVEEAESEEEAEPLVEPETADTPEVVGMAPSAPFKEPEPVVEGEPEAAAELVTTPAIEQAAPVVAPSLAAAPPRSAEPELTAEPIAELAATDESAPKLVLTAESNAEEKADVKAEEKAAAKLAARQKKLDESSEQSPFSVFVGQVYDGPLDLLLDLIRKQDIDIYDIPIARITAQFLAYVNQLRAGDVDVAGEFIYTASLLIHIKSKMLLPRAPSGPEDVAEDPRRELVERLLEHERFKNAAQMLQQKQMLEAATWSNPGVREFKGDEGAEPEIAADTVDLVRIFRDILERARNRPVLDVEEDSVTVGQMIQFLARRLTMEDKPVALRRLLSHTRSERALIAMFLALLEMVRMQAILLRQDRQFSEIFIKKHTGFDAVMNEGLGNARDDWR